MNRRTAITQPMMSPIGRVEGADAPWVSFGPVGALPVEGAALIDVTTPLMVTICIDERAVTSAPAARGMPLTIDNDMDIVEDPSVVSSDTELSWLVAILVSLVLIAEGLPVGVSAATAAVGDAVSGPPAQMKLSSWNGKLPWLTTANLCCWFPPESNPES